MRIWWQNSFEESGFDLRRSSRDLKKKEKNWKKFFFSIYFTWMNSSIFEWNLHGSKSKTKFFKVVKNWNILFISRHCIYFETLYLFWEIVFILRNCIYFETLYLFQDIVLISRHCINFETLYLFRDIIFMPRKRIYLCPVKTNGESAGFSSFESAEFTLPYHRVELGPLSSLNLKE